MKPDAGLGKFLTGAVAGAALSFLYIIYGYQPPVVTKLIDIPKEVAVLAMDIVADEVLYDPNAVLADQQRAMAYKISADSGFYQKNRQRHSQRVHERGPASPRLAAGRPTPCRPAGLRQCPPIPQPA